MHRVVGRFLSFAGWTGLHGLWLQKRHFGPDRLARLADVIRAGETRHHGELVVVIESSLPDHCDHDSRLRALEIFGRNRVWDTPDRTGVLLYLALGDHCLELVADRGIAVADADWTDVCAGLQRTLQQGGDKFDAVLDTVERIERLLHRACPPRGDDGANHLPDHPVLI